MRKRVTWDLPDDADANDNNNQNENEAESPCSCNGDEAGTTKLVLLGRRRRGAVPHQTVLESSSLPLFCVVLVPPSLVTVNVDFGLLKEWHTYSFDTCIHGTQQLPGSQPCMAAESCENSAALPDVDLLATLPNTHIASTHMPDGSEFLVTCSDPQSHNSGTEPVRMCESCSMVARVSAYCAREGPFTCTLQCSGVTFCISARAMGDKGTPL
ncbi:hypothetical protein Pelo_18244 [Pelomyxa schiedti]|nr:hypothetical protein Pelo_18244 [Pelomyxa schiedti]